MRLSLQTFRFHVLGPLLAISLAMLPAARILVFLLTHGENNLSNDDLMIVPLVGKILDGTYPWYRFFHDTFLNGHSVAAPMLLQVMFALFLEWDLKYILIANLAISVATLFLFFGIFCTRIRSSWRWAFLPLLSALVFSPSQLSVYEFSFTSVVLAQFGFAVGLWGLFYFKNEKAAVLVAIAGGILSSWSYGAGLLVWPIYGMVLYFHRSHWGPKVALMTAALFAALPYIYFLILFPTKDLYHLVEIRDSASAAGVLVQPSLHRMLQGLGWPLTPGFSADTALDRGIVAAGFIFLLLYLLRWNRESVLRFLPALSILGYGLLTILLVTTVRGNFAPWYTKPFMMVWLGLVGFVVLGGNFLSQKQTYRNLFLNAEFFNVPSWIVLFSASLIFIYATSGLSLADKSFYLRSRSPAASSCLRQFETAPTYCVQELFLWNPGQYWLLSSLGRPLQKHRLSVFASNQVWSLQGDFILDSVSIENGAGQPGVFWTLGDHNEEVSFNDYRRLNLFLHGGNAISWTVDLSDLVTNADLFTAAAIRNLPKTDLAMDGVVLKIWVEMEGKPSTLIYSDAISPNQAEWKGIHLPLRKWLGEKITLRLEAESGANSNFDWLSLRFPHIKIKTDTSIQSKEKTAPSLPSNTELGGRVSFDKNINATTLWSKHDLDQSGIRDFVELRDMQASLVNQSHIYFRIAVPRPIYPRLAKVSLQMEHQEGFQKEIILPLLPDSQAHSYAYDFKLLRPLGQSLTAIKVEIPWKKDGTIGPEIQEIGLVKSPR